MTAALPAQLPEAVEPWLADRRWFGGKGRPIDSVTVVADTVLSEDPALHHVIVEVGYSDKGASELYQVPIGIVDELPEHLAGAHIGEVEGGIAYDACVDPAYSNLLLNLLATDASVGPLAFHAEPRGEDDEPFDTSLHGRLIAAEQSNTSLLYGEAYVCKIFRRLSPGLNPDLEVSRALAARGSTAVPPPLAWAEAPLDGIPTTLALLQPYLRLATEGWALATTSVRDLFAEADLHADEVGGDFAGEAERLGHTTALVHADLAAVLPTSIARKTQLKQLAKAMSTRLTAAVRAVPEIASFEEPLQVAFSEIGGLEEAVPMQRIHGDLHLGQVLRTDAGWTLLDFEGEPAKPLAERTALDSPLRDVAGMLRSFDYASRHLLADGPEDAQLAYRASEWAERNREAFCDGYAEASGADPRKSAELLRAYELDKAVYEVVYEARNRPTWLPIPLEAIARLVT